MPTIYTSDKSKLPKAKNSEFCVTPFGFCIKAIEEVARPEMVLYSEKDSFQVLDPGAGSGAWGMAIAKLFPNAKVVGVEKRRVRNPGLSYYDFWYSGQDYLTWEKKYKFDLIVGNPPFSLAESFIWYALDQLAPSGVLMFLLPIDFSGSIGRGRGLFQKRPPTRIVSPMQRINFNNAGSNNVNLYDLYLWTKPPVPTTQTLHTWLDWKESK